MKKMINKFNDFDSDQFEKFSSRMNNDKDYNAEDEIRKLLEEWYVKLPSKMNNNPENIPWTYEYAVKNKHLKDK